MMHGNSNIKFKYQCWYYILWFSFRCNS